MKKDKMAERLSERQVCNLVKIYKEYECLWDCKNENYKEREIRDQAYKEICEKLNVPGLKATDIPQKIKNLRTSYYMELRKIESSIKAGGKVYKPKLVWFSIAHKILRNVSRNHLACSLPVETVLIEPELNVTEANKDEKPNTTATIDKISTKVIPQANYEEDEFDSYGKYIAVCLRSMPKDRSILARMELQKTMADIQLRALRQRNRVKVKYGPSTSKMEEDPLEEPLGEEGEMNQDLIYSNVQLEDNDL